MHQENPSQAWSWAFLSFQCTATFALGDVYLPRRLGLSAASLPVGCVCMLSAVSRLVCLSPSVPLVPCAYVVCTVYLVGVCLSLHKCLPKAQC